MEKEKEKSKITGLRNMRIVYSIAGIFLVLSLLAIILGFLVINQLPYNQPILSNGLTYVTWVYQSSNVPMNTMGILLSADKTKSILFSDNLYVLDLKNQIILWKALPISLNTFYAYLTLSPFGNLTIETFNQDSSNFQEIWRSNSLCKQDIYNLTVTNEGIMQISNANSSIVIWNTK